MEVTSKGDLILYVIMTLPMYVALAVLTWKLSPAGVHLLTNPITYSIQTGLAVLYVLNVYKIYHTNKEHLKTPVAEIHRYKFKQVAVLNLAYMVTFGSELAVISMLPLFFSNIYHLSAVGAGLLAAVFASLNLIARPGGGMLSDKFGRKRALVVLLAGTTVGYLLMSLIGPGWPIAFAIAVTMFASLFVHAGNGAVFAVVPLIKRRLTGQIAGMSGAYGNVGAVSFLTVLSFVSPQIFFTVIAGSAATILVITSIFMEEPSGHMAEILPDGTVHMIEVE